MLESLRQDVTHAFRALGEMPGVASVALISLAVGIAANATVFSLVQAVAFPTLPYPEASRLVFLEGRNATRNLTGFPVSAPDALDLAAASHAFESSALTADASVTIREAATPVRFTARAVARTFFDVLRISPAQGRIFAEADDDTVILGDRIWRAELAADPAIVGRVIQIDDRPRTVIGVMPPAFDTDADLWVPLPWTASSAARRDDRQFMVFARLAPGRTADDAVREAEDVSARLAAEYPSTNGGWAMVPTPLARLHGQDSRATFLLLQAAVAIVLLIACANIANILLAHGTRRAHEMAVRAALGASRGRLVRQLLTESAVLALAGGALGLILTLWGIRAARGLIDLPASIQPRLNLMVAGFAAAISIITGVVCGLLPAFRTSNTVPRTALETEGSRGATSPGARAGWRSTLVATQVAAAVVLATGAALLVQSLLNRERVDLGFDPHSAMRADVSFSGPRYQTADSQRLAVARLLADLERDPAVAVAGASAWVLSRGAGVPLHVTLPARGDAIIGAGAPNAVEAVTTDYFQAMAVPVTRGRIFSAADRAGAPLVAIVNDEFARRTWPDRNPIGESIRLGTPAESAPVVTIVGVVGSIRQSVMHGSVSPRVYVPYQQYSSPEFSLVVRARGDVGAAATAMRTAIRETDPALVLDGVRTVDDDIARYADPVRFMARLLTAFGVTGVLLAALGVFGTMSYVVSMRLREMAVRTALGATRTDVLRLVLMSGLRITAIGVAVGAIAAAFAARTLGAFLFGVTPADPRTLVLVTAGLSIVSIGACYRPARRAASVDPMTVLRRD